MNPSNQLEEAEGFIALGMYSDAWEATEELPPIDRVMPATLEVRLRILTALEKWELGAGIANVLAASVQDPEMCRRTVARFYHAHARTKGVSGDYEGMRAEIRKAVNAWQEIRSEFSDQDLDQISSP